MAKRADHLHKFKKVTLGNNGYKVFKCQEAACSYFTRVELAEGKLCKCNRCGNPMVLDKKAMRLTRPHCPDCTRESKRSQVIDAFTELFEKES